jgi:hypothetical protein
MFSKFDLNPTSCRKQLQIRIYGEAKILLVAITFVRPCYKYSVNISWYFRAKKNVARLEGLKEILYP